VAELPDGRYVCFGDFRGCVNVSALSGPGDVHSAVENRDMPEHPYLKRRVLQGPTSCYPRYVLGVTAVVDVCRASHVRCQHSKR